MALGADDRAGSSVEILSLLLGLVLIREVNLTGELGSLVSGNMAEYDGLDEGVGSEAVRAVDSDRGALACCVESLDGACGLAVGLDSAHGVVDGRAYRDRRIDRVKSYVCLGELADERQTLVEVLLAEMAEVEFDDIAERGLEGAALLLLLPECLGDAVAGSELHVLALRMSERGHRAQAVVLQVAVAVLVGEHSALAAARLGHEDAASRKSGRVVLHELHVTELCAVAVGKGHAVAGYDSAVGVELVAAA